MNSVLRSSAVAQSPFLVTARVENPPLSYCVFEIASNNPYLKGSIRFLGGADWMVNITPAVKKTDPMVYYATICAPPNVIESAMAYPGDFISKNAKQLLTLDPHADISLGKVLSPSLPNLNVASPPTSALLCLFARVSCTS